MTRIHQYTNSTLSTTVVVNMGTGPSTRLCSRGRFHTSVTSRPVGPTTTVALKGAIEHVRGIPQTGMSQIGSTHVHKLPFYADGESN
jgi:hypothetical protein